MNHKQFFKRHKRTALKTTDTDIGLDKLYDMIRDKLISETNLEGCNCSEHMKKAGPPHGWLCPLHGHRTEL